MPLKIESLEITLGGTTYRTTAVQVVNQAVSPRRLILSLTRFFGEGGAPEYSDEVFLARARAIKHTFAWRFPTAQKFREVSCLFADFSEWKYVLSHVEEKQIEWAAVAKACGLIDAYLVDYAPTEE